MNLRYDVNSFANDLMKQKQQLTSECLLNMPSVTTDDVSFNQPDKGSNSKNTTPLTGNANSICNMDRHEIAAMIVEQILNQALNSIFRKKESTQSLNEECMKSDTLESFSNVERIKICLKNPNEFQLCSVYPEGDGMVSSSFNSPLHDNNYNLVPEQLQRNDLGRNFSKTGSVKKTNLINLEKDIVSNSSVSNKAKESMVLYVNSTSEKCERKPKFDFSILREMLSGGEYFPSYLPNDTELTHILSVDNREMTTTLPKCDEHAASNLQLLAKSSNTCTTLKDVKNIILDQSNTALTREKIRSHFANELCGISPITSPCNVKKMTAHLELADSVTNNFDNIIQRKTDSVVNLIKTNKLTSTVKSVPVNVQMNHSNLISTFVTGSLRTVSLLNTTQSNLTQNDQTVPTVINKVMQNVFDASRDSSVKTLTDIRNVKRDMSLPHKSSALNKTRTPDYIESLCNDYSTNDCDEIISLDLLQMFTIKRTKRVIEQNFEFCDSNNLVPKVHVNKINNVVNHKGFGNSTIASTAEVKMLNPVPTVCSPTSKNSSVQININVLSNKDAHKPSNFDYNDLFEISNSSWSDIDLIKEGVDDAEKALDKIVEERVLVHLPLLNEGGGDNFAADSDASDIDELDKVIDDSIKKYEHFTVDASVLATPSTSEKSCQTEIEIEHVDRCKRCLEFVDEPTKPIKKKKLSSNEESYFELPTSSACHIDFNESPAYSTVDITTHNDSKILPGSTERVQFGHLSSPVNSEGLLTTISNERFPKCNCPRTDEVLELDNEESLFDAEENEELNQMDWSNESSYDSEQEVPINLHDNEGIPPPFPFVTPKKPALRVGLSRSARFRPLHPRM